MKLWLLRPARYDDDEFWEETRSRVAGNPWSPWYDKAFGFVVRAISEKEARQLAADDDPELAEAWRDPMQSSCVDLTYDGLSGIIIRDFHRA